MNSDEQIPAAVPAHESPLLARFKTKIREQYEAEVTGAAVRHLETIKKIDGRAHILARVPERLIDKCYFYGSDQLDFDNLSRDDAVAVMVAMKAGTWTKAANPTHPTQIDYEATIDGFKIRLWAAGPPDTCRIVDYEQIIPARVIKGRRLVCKEDATPKPATPPCQHSYVEGSTVCTICGA